MSRRRATLSFLFIVVVFAILLVPAARSDRQGPRAVVPSETGAGMALRFESGDPGTFEARGIDGRVSLDPRRALLATRPAAASTPSPTGPSDGLAVRLVGASSDVTLEGLDPYAGPTNYLLGSDPGAWRRDVVAFRSVRAKGVYPGIDLVYSGTTRRLDFRFELAAGADPSVIAFAASSAVAADGTGGLRAATPLGAFSVGRPTARQVVDAQTREIESELEANDDGTVGFRVADRDAARPSEISFSVLLPDRLDSETLRRPASAFRLAVDTTGRAYVAGTVPSSGPGRESDVMVARLDRTGNEVEFVTYFGGDGADAVEAIAVDAMGQITIVGTAASSAMPGVSAAMGTASGDAFAARLSDDGRSVLWTTMIGGSRADTAHAVLVDASGDTWIAGETASADLAVAGVSPPESSAGGRDAFVARLSPDGAPRWIARLGGSADDSARAMALDASANLYIAGVSESPSSRDALVATISSDGTVGAVRALRGSGDDEANAIAVDPSGRPVVAGATASGLLDGQPPRATIGAGGGRDAFLAWLTPDLQTIEAWSRFGGMDDDDVRSLTINRSGHVLVAGRAGGGFPTTASVDHPGPFGRADAYVAILGSQFDALASSVLEGGPADDTATAAAVDTNGRVWMSGLAGSASLDRGRAVHALASGDLGFVDVVDDFSGELAPQVNCGAGSKKFDGGPSGTGTAWQTAANWSGDTLPTSSDDVCIDGASFAVVLGSGAQNAGTLLVQNNASLTVDGGSLTIAGASQVDAELTLSGGTLNGAGNVTISGLFTWSGGTMSGTGITTANGGMALGGGFLTLSRRLDNASNGTATYTGPTYGFTINSPGVFNNVLGSTFDQQSAATINGTGTFNNPGTFLRTTSALADVISCTFNNTGTVDVQTGTLTLNGAGTHTGDFDSTGAILEIGAATQTFSATSDITGTEVDFTGATATFSGTYDVAGTTKITSGTVNFNGATLNLIGVGPALEVSGGTVTFSSGETIAPTTVDFSGGTITGSDNVTVSGLLTWSGGTMSGTGITTANGGMALGGGFLTVSRRLDNANNKTATYTGPSYGFTINTPGVFNNVLGSTFDQQSDATINGTGTFNNPGTFLRTTSALADAISCTFNNTGIVDVQTGTLTLNGAGTHTGDFDSTGALLDIGAATHTFSATSDVTGTEVDFTGATATLSGSYNVTGTTKITSGTVNFTGATLNLTGVGSALEVTGGTVTLSSGEAVGPTTVDFSGGTITGSDNITVSGLFTWSGGTMSGTGITTANGGMALGDGFLTVSRRLDNANNGTATHSGPSYAFTINSPGVFNNLLGSTFDQQSAATINGTGTFNNPGTFLRTTSALADVISCTFNNTGTVDVQTGTLTLNGAGTHTGDFDSTGAILEIGAATHTFSATSDITGTEVDFTGATATLSGSYNVTGTTRITSGTVNFTGATLNLIDVGSALEVTGGTVTFSSGETIAPTTVDFSGGTITGSDNVTVSGLLTWSGGTMSGTGITTANGGMALGGGFLTVARRLDNASNGTATYTGPSYAFTINTPGVFNNVLGSTFDQQSAATINGTGTFNNPGTFLRTTSALADVISCTFNNTGNVDVQTGALTLNGAGTHTGDFDSTGAILEIGAATHTFSATSDVTGTEVDFTGATATFSGTYDVTGTTKITSGTVNFTGATLNLIDVGSALEVTGGTVTFSSGETIAPTTIDFSSGTITGSDNIAVSGLFTWSSGTMSGTGITTANGGMALGGAFPTLARRLDNANNGTATYTGLAYGFFINSPGVFNNLLGSTFDQQSDATVSGTGTFNNPGTFLRTTSALADLISCTFNNTGTVDVQSGKLSLSGNGAHTGSFDSTGAVLSFDGGTHALSAASSVTGTEVDVTSGTITVGGTYNVAGTTSMSNGALTFSSTSTVTSIGSTLDLSAGTLSFNSGETIAPATFQFSGGTLTGSDLVSLSGPFTWTAGEMSGTGTTTANGGVTIDTFGVQLSRIFNNANGSTAVLIGVSTNIAINAPGVWNNLAGSTFEARNDGLIFGNGTFANAGTFLRTTGTGNFTVQAPMTNSGTVESRSGALLFNQTYTQTAGATRVNGGSIELPFFYLFAIQGGAFGGSGALGGNGGILTNSGGSLAPGFSAGTIAGPTDSYTQGPGGTYAVEIGGLTAGTQHDQIEFQTVSLDGALNVTFINGFAPSIGDVFTVVKSQGRSGTFASTNLPAFGCGKTWNIVYTATDVELHVVAQVGTADLSLTDTDAPDPIPVGDTLTYTLTVSNLGPSSAGNTTVTDTLPAGVTFVNAVPSQGTCGQAAGVVTCALGTVANAAGATVTITVTPTAPGPITNKASVTSDACDPSPGNETDITAGTTVFPACPDADTDGFAVCDASCLPGGGDQCGDCDDAATSIHPGAIEACNGVDDDCAGGVPANEADADSDNFRVCANDCNDANPAVNPGIVEQDPLCGDAIDNDCDGKTDLLDPSCLGICPDSDTDGWADCAANCTPDVGVQCGDCNDANAAIHPGATEITGDGVDQDCDGAEVCFTDADDDGYRPNAASTVASADTDCNDAGEAVSADPTGDCNDANAAINPGAIEVVGDGVDQNCDGAETCYLDADDDGYRPNASATVASADTDCSDAGEAVSADPTTDCNDVNAAINPGATEIAGDSVDQDCDGAELCYADADDDGYRPNATATVASADTDCTDPGEAVSSDLAGDCNDADAAIHPGVIEIIGDSVDQNCDGAEVCFADADNDGYRPGAASTVASTDIDCNDPGEAVPADPIGDCNDANAAINTGAIEIAGDGVDQDCDGAEICYLDADDDGFRPDATATVASVDTDCSDAGEAVSTDPTTDCNDASAAIHPGAIEIAGDNVDQDCDGAELCYTDADDDGYRPNAASTVASADTDCNDAGEAVSADPTGDCNEANAAIHPGATEIVGDGVDQNCDGVEQCFFDLDDDGYRPNLPLPMASADTDCNDAGEAISADPTGDCNDADAAIHPGTIEIIGDSVDQNCDGAEVCYADADDDGYRPDATATVASADTDCDDASEARSFDPTTDCNDANVAINPGAIEIAGDSVDQNCDGAETCYLDADDDGYRPNAASTVASTDTDCNDAGEAVLADPTTDCNDANVAINPGASEIAGDSVDQNCDGAETCYLDADDDGYRPSAIATVASADTDCTDPGEAVSSDLAGDCNDANAAIHPGVIEIIGDSVDQNCDGAEVCFTDADDDGYRPNAASTVASTDIDCNDAGEAVPADPTGDCNDANAAIHPGAAEITGDGVDQNCDGGEVCFLDADNDGYRPDAISTVVSADTDCSDSGEALLSDPTNDCDDTYAGCTTDCSDNNGNSTPDCAELCPDADGDNYAVCDAICSLVPGDQCGDCNDAVAAIRPGATEIAGDGVDQNCDGAEVCFTDADDDGYRPNAASTVPSPDTDCDDAGEAVSADPTGDCNDASAAINPGATEITGDSVDQNCDGAETCYLDADNDGYRPNGASTVASVDADCNDAGEAVSADPTTDCNDANAAIHPGATEIAGDSVDLNCDGAELCYTDADDDGYRPNAASTVASADTDCNDAGEAVSADPTGDCNEANAAIHPGATEIVGDGVDQNCDGVEQCFIDFDDDGYRPNVPIPMASVDTDCNDAGEAISADPTGDCNDADAAIHPGTIEIIGDSVDQNCDGAEVCYADADDDGYRPNATATVASADTDCDDASEARSFDPTTDCNDANVAISPGVTETGAVLCADTVDNDCDGFVDSADIIGCGLAATVCDTLGDQPAPQRIDQDAWTFQGHQGETVTAQLAANGAATGRADLVLIDDMGTAVRFFQVDRTALPNSITATLPADGAYKLVVLQQPSALLLPGRPFLGAYCVTFAADLGAAPTMTPTPSVESVAGAPPPGATTPPKVKRTTTKKPVQARPNTHRGR